MVERKKGAGGERGAKTRRTEDSKGKRGNEAETAKGRGPGKGEERVARKCRGHQGSGREGWVHTGSEGPGAHCNEAPCP